MIKVIINNKDVEIGENVTVQQLLDERGILNGAVWVNDIQLGQKEYDSYTLDEGDKVRIMRLIAGG